MDGLDQKSEMDNDAYEFGPVDWEQLRLVIRLTPAQRLRVMLEARALAVALIPARLRRQFPDLSPREINLKLVEEVSRDRSLPRL